MLSEQGKTELSSKMKKVTIVWVAMMGSVGLFVVATLALLSDTTKLPNIDTAVVNVLMGGFVVVSAVNIMLVTVIDKKIKSNEIIAAFLKRRGETLASIRSGNDGAVRVLYPFYFQTCLVKWALCETVGVCGLVMALVTGSVFVPVTFYVVSVALLARLRPSTGEFMDIVKMAMR
ncbi:hypothetical protein MNBD_NITROSPINAE01-1023 [hydrothermal vent metagenome]|uniref:Uncharacterized protein n=1 Tax=hydrothermal vent metagenome TaxID=652676 RepID=A0A3B1BYG8_9ZZZZ